MLYLRVWFVSVFNRIDLPRLQTLDFGANAFRDCIQVQFESVAWELRLRNRLARTDYHSDGLEHVPF